MSLGIEVARLYLPHTLSTLMVYTRMQCARSLSLVQHVIAESKGIPIPLLHLLGDHCRVMMRLLSNKISHLPVESERQYLSIFFRQLTLTSLLGDSPNTPRIDCCFPSTNAAK